MQANPRTSDSSCGWVDVSDLAAGRGLAAQVCISRAAWLDAVYFVREAGDRLDPIREGWRMRRLLEEVRSAVDTRGGPGPDAREFTLSLEEGFDRLRCLALPGVRLKVRVEHEHESPEIWVDVASGRTSPDGGIRAGH